MTYEESFTVELKREINADFKKKSLRSLTLKAEKSMSAWIKTVISPVLKIRNKRWNKLEI